MKHKTVTLTQIQTLKWARDQTAGWKGNINPDSHDEFDEWIADIDDAIRAVVCDRALLRQLLQKENKL